MSLLRRTYYSGREADLGLWLAAYLTTAVRGRYRPVLILRYSNHRLLMSHGLFCHQGEGGPRMIEGVIVYVLAIMCQRTTGQAW